MTKHLRAAALVAAGIALAVCLLVAGRALAFDTYQPTSDTNPLPITLANPKAVLTQTAGASVTCGVASGALIAAGSSARWVRFENIDAAGDGFHFAIGGAAATTGQLVPAGGVIWRYTAAAINCIRTAAADSTVSVQEITQ